MPTHNDLDTIKNSTEETEFNYGRNRWVALFLSVFIGALGVDRFYLGKIGTGILKLITGGGFGIWWIIDIVLIATGEMTDKQGRRLDDHNPIK